MQNNVLDYLSQIVTKVPDKMAFSDGTDSLTFLELYDQSRSIGTFLHNNKVYKEPVVIFMDKHPNTIAAFLGVITGGDYYVPIDAEMPEIRIELILKNVKAKIMICDQNTIDIARKFNFEGKIVI